MGFDFAEITCNGCGRRFMQPFPSMQRNPPEAPTSEEMRIAGDIVVERLKYHQNKECRLWLKEKGAPLP